jgi:predicted HD superfamily hydrolase involved in NAD metabolism
MNETIELAKKQVNKKLEKYPKRLKHVYGVSETAVKLAKVYGVNQDKMTLAGLYHDYAKYDDIDLSQLTKDEEEVVGKYAVMYHAYQGAHLIVKNLEIKDKDIIDSIKAHVWGKPNMTIYEKILFVSDYCEPNRTFLDIDHIYQLAKTDLDAAVKTCMKISIDDLLKRNIEPSDLQLEAYNYYKEAVCGKEIKINY